MRCILSDIKGSGAYIFRGIYCYHTAAALFFQVYEEKEKMWERELRKIKGLYDNRLRASQHKSSKMEQALSNQTFQVRSLAGLSPCLRLGIWHFFDAPPNLLRHVWASNGMLLRRLSWQGRPEFLTNNDQWPHISYFC